MTKHTSESVRMEIIKIIHSRCKTVHEAIGILEQCKHMILIAHIKTPPLTEGDMEDYE